MSERGQDVRHLSDEQLVERYRELKTETGGNDPKLVPPEDDLHSVITAEMERRGLSPDREDVIPGKHNSTGDPVVKDRA